jgi:hypothetical protein
MSPKYGCRTPLSFLNQVIWGGHLTVCAGRRSSLFFNGSIVLFVLRPAERADTYALLGDGYVDGFMPGQDPGVQRSSEEWFNLV